MLVYANVFIAICAFAQVFMTYLLFKIPFNFDTISYLIFILLSTYVQYNMQRGYLVNPNGPPTERSSWLLKNKKILLISNLICLVALIFLCNSLSWTSIFIMIGAEVVATLYYMPPFYLRKYGYFKPFLISAIWAISCVLVPLIEFSTVTPNSIYFLIAKFLFIAELCVVFDINDSEKDFQSGVFTYANKLGLSFTKFFCILLLSASGVMYGLYIKQVLPIIFAAAFLTLCAVFAFLSNNKKKL